MKNGLTRQSTWIQLQDQEIFSDIKSDYYNDDREIERLHDYINHTVVWYGYNTNFKRVDGKWFKLVKSDFVESEEPIYEKIYKELKSIK